MRESGGYVFAVRSPTESQDSRRVAFLSNHRHGRESGRQDDLLVVDAGSRRITTAYALPRETCESRSGSGPVRSALELYGWVR